MNLPMYSHATVIWLQKFALLLISWLKNSRLNPNGSAFLIIEIKQHWLMIRGIGFGVHRHAFGF